MKQKTIGTYSDGREHYLVVLVEGDDSCGYNHAENVNMGLIRLGADIPGENDLYDELLHEIQELILNSLGLRCVPTIQQVGFGGRMWFVFDHADYSEVCARTAKFMITCWPDALKAWKEWRKK